jgi:alpha-galactosidase
MKDFLFLVLLFTATTTFPQQFINKSDNEITLDNGVIKEKISISEDSICPVELLHHTSEQNFIEKSRGFSFSLNDKKFSGYTGWKIMKNETIRDKTGGRGLKMLIRPADQTIKIQVTLHYMLYPGLPVIRKWITIKNTDESELKLEKVNIEDLVTTLSHVSSQVYHNYGRMKHLDKYIGNWDDPVVVVHNVTERRGIALGNETVGVLKRTTYHNNINSVEIGLTYPDQDFAFRKWLKPGESWESPKVFIAVYTNADDGFQIINNDVNEFVVKHMNPRIVTLDKKPTFVYNTWYPFRTFINDSLVREVARAAAECGIQEFILDDGWQINIGGETSEKGWGNNYGDWQVDTAKFPGGLKPTFDYIRTLGMKPGLWISIGAATKDAKVFKEHPEWFVKNENGKLTDLHLPNEQSDFYTSCYGTGWFNYIKQTILRLVNEHGLAYAKLDFAVVTSAYINDNSRSGCYATDHPHHKDRAESHWVLYQRLLKLFDELHEEAPEHEIPGSLSIPAGIEHFIK